MEAKDLAEKLAGKSPDTLSASEWRTLLLDIIKQNDHAALISLLQQIPDALKDACLSPVDGSNLLEYAILNSCWDCAHVLVHFECGAQILSNKADESSWAKVIYLITRRYKKSGEIKSLQNEKYQPVLKERMKAYFEAYKNGCVSLFAAVDYPSTFILLTQLGAKITQKRDKKTVVTLVLESKAIVYGIKLQMLQYIKRRDNNLLFEPSGPEGTPPVFHFYQNNCKRLISGLNITFWDVATLRSESDKTLADVISMRHLPKLVPKKDLIYFFLRDNTLGVLAQRASKLRLKFQYPQIAEALEALVADNRPIPEIFKETSSMYSLAYLQELGAKDLQLGDLEKFYGKRQRKVIAAAKRIEYIQAVSRKNNVGQFPLDQLPVDILALFAKHLSLQEMMAVFSVSKVMRIRYSSNSSPLLWKNVAKNTLNSIKCSMCEQNSNNQWKDLVHSQSRVASNWVKGKSKERYIHADTISWHLTLSEHWACYNTGTGVQFWNCDTDEKPSLIQCPTYMDACFMESSSSRDPVVAAQVLGKESVVNILSSTKVLGTILLPQPAAAFKITALDKDHVICADYMGLIDINQQKVIKSLPARTASIHTVNKFSSSLTIPTFSRDIRAIRTYDKDMKLVQTINIPWYTNYDSISAIDEHRYLLTKHDGFIVMDTRYTKESDVFQLATKFPTRDYLDPWRTQVNQAVDVPNSRLVVDAWPFGLTMIWDLKTLTWSSVRRNNNNVPRTNHIAINSRYEVMLDIEGHIRVNDYS